MRAVLTAIGLLFAVAAAHAFGNLGGVGKGASPAYAPPAYFTQNAGFPRLQNALLNPANQIIACIGESTPAGWGAFYNSGLVGSDEHSGSVCNETAIQLRHLGYNVRTNSVSGNNNTGIGSVYATYDTRVAPGTWLTSTAGGNGCTFSNTVNSSPIAATGNSYNSATGLVTLNLTITPSYPVGTATLQITGLTGTGTNLSSLNQTNRTVASITGNVITYTTTTGLGAITITGGYTQFTGSSNLSPGGCYWNNADNTSIFTFTPNDTATYPSNTSSSSGTDTLDVYWFSLNGLVPGTLSINNGGAVCGTINTGGSGTAFQLTKTTITCPGTGTQWFITATAGTSFWSTIVARLASAPEVSLINMAISGATTAAWMGTAVPLAGSANLTPNLIQGIEQMFSPVGAIVQLGGNDISNSATLTNTVIQYNTSFIISTLQPTADVLLITTNPQQSASVVGSGKAPYDIQQGVVSAVLAGGAAQNAAFYDQFKYLCGTITGTGGSAVASKACWNEQAGGWNAQNGGRTADPDHLGVAYYATEASAIVNMIRPPQRINLLKGVGPANDNVARRLGKAS